ncbi:YIF1-domain-containing protein [Blastocladiella britannica]|nr:YIF1-domain-containing protein [Blastocladiella britannica]
MHDPTGQMGMNMGAKAASAGQEYLNQNLNRYVNVPHLKFYFNVDNSYVLSKLRLVLFPFRQTHWTRITMRSNPSAPYGTGTPAPMHGAATPGPADYRPPREDLLSPDLYIPTMAFVTYILLSGLEMGTRGQFHPSALGLAASTAMFLAGFLVVLMKLGGYLLSVYPAVPVLDAAAYAGYMFVGVDMCIVAAMLAPAVGLGVAYWAVLGYAVVAASWFAMRALKPAIITAAMAPSASAVGSGPGGMGPGGLHGGNAMAAAAAAGYDPAYLQQQQYMAAAGAGGIASASAGRKRKLNLLLAVVAFQAFAMACLVPWSGVRAAAIGTGPLGAGNGGFGAAVPIASAADPAVAAAEAINKRGTW